MCFFDDWTGDLVVPALTHYRKIPGNLLSCFAMQFSDGSARVLRPVCRCWPGDVVSRCLDVADRARSITVPVNDQRVETVLVIVRGSG
jgi:hypothetical protein